MPRKREALEKHTIRLFNGDFSRLAIAHPSLGGNVVIRVLVRRHLNEIAARANGRREVVQITLEEAGLGKR